MPADPRYDEVHEKTRATAESRYGCHDQPRPSKDGFVVGAECYGSQKWVFQNSIDCQHSAKGFSASDPWCTGCQWRHEQ